MAVKYRYFIYVYRNKKKHKLVHKAATKKTIMDAWDEVTKEKKPVYTAEVFSGTTCNIELVLVFPNFKGSTPLYKKDELGRNIIVTYEDPKFRIKKIIPYWYEELIYDYRIKKRIRFHELMESLYKINEISQIFTLNNKIAVQTDDEIIMYGNKNLPDTMRLFELIREDLIKKKRTNFIFVRDVSTVQRKMLYDMLEAKGWKRQELFKHHSYRKPH